ncbi:MAG: methylmalonyl Co-A mutase-associated GTPase MeaB, partial [Flavobacterium sp.]
IVTYQNLVKENGYFETKRIAQNEYWMLETIQEQLKTTFFTHPKVSAALNHYKEAVSSHQLSPFAAAQALLDLAKTLD